VALSKQFGVKGSDPEVKKLMVTLRRMGFSSSEIRKLSDRRWSSTLVRQYTKEWGGVNEVMDNQRKSLMATLRELSLLGKDANDVEYVIKLNRSVLAKDSSLEEVAELNSNLMKLDLQRGEIGKLVTLSRELFEETLTPGTVKAWMTLDDELIKAGFNKAARITLYNLCYKYSGVLETLNAVNEFNNLREIQLRARSSQRSLD
jgi:hypothetical protein